MGLIRALLVGVLIIAAVFVMASAIVYAAPYLATLIILVLIGYFLIRRTNQNQDNYPP